MRVSPPPSSSAPVRVEIRPGVWLDSRRALWLADERRLVVADLHWGYAAAHRARGNLLPHWGDAEIERTLDALLAAYLPVEMIWLGDVVHAAAGAAPAESFLRRAPVATTVIAGNHDRRWTGATVRSISRGRYFLHHGDGAPAVPPDAVEVIGHHHPAVMLDDGAGSRLKLPALVVSAQRIVLPAFSPWAAGSPWAPAGDARETLWAIGPRRIFALPPGRPAAKLAAR
jgi:hypothetical protein